MVSPGLNVGLGLLYTSPHGDDVLMKPRKSCAFGKHIFLKPPPRVDCGEPEPHSGRAYVLKRFYSSMRFPKESVFTEIFLKRIKGKQIVFARVDGAKSVI